MKKYYLFEGGMQEGPYDLDELKTKNITAGTPIWYDSLPDWTTAGQVDELKDIILHQPPSFHAIPPATPAATSSIPVAVPVQATTPSSHRKKSSAWLSWVLSLLVIAGAGYFVYQDIDKNAPITDKGGLPNAVLTADTTHQQTMPVTSAINPPPIINKDQGRQVDSVINTKTQEALATTSKKEVSNNIPAQPITKKKNDDAEKKAAVLNAADAEIRNHWPHYVTFGKLDYKSKSIGGISAFDVPVYNATNATIDKVTVRLDYVKSGGGIFKSETIEIVNIPPRGGQNGKAPSSSRGTSVNAYIVAIHCAKLHFCYPQNNGNVKDPYYCK